MHVPTHSCMCNTQAHVCACASLTFSHLIIIKTGLGICAFIYIKMKQWRKCRWKTSDNGFMWRKSEMKVACSYLFIVSEPHNYNKNDKDKITKSQKQYEIILNVRMVPFIHGNHIVCLKSTDLIGYADRIKQIKQTWHGMMGLSFRKECT